VSRPTKPSLPLREKAVALTGALTLAYTAWGFGGVPAWSLHIMLAGGLLTFLLAVVPLGGWRDPRSGMRGRRSGILRLASRIAAPVFVVAFLIYLAIAALNPAWHIVSDARGWWLESVAPPLAGWLPTSVEASYDPMNAWRIFNMHLAAFSLALGLYLGLSSRRSTQFVLWSLLVSVALMAAVAIAQKYAGAEAVLWTLKSENQNFWGSFFYRNQGTAFLNWGIVIAGVLYFYHARRSREALRSGGPHFLAFCLIGLIAVSVGLALSRGGILFAAVLCVCFLLLVLIDFALSSSRFPLSTIVPLAGILALLLSAGLYQANRAIDWQAVEERFGDIGETIEEADRDARVLSSKLTWKMAQDQLWTGWGAGSFRYAFPMYQQEVPELFYGFYHRKRQEWMGRKFYRYAHNDILQFLAEYGVVGSGLLLLAIAGFLLPALSAIRRAPFAALFLLAGIACAAGHAFLDFIFHSPAYWVAFIAGIALVSRLLQLCR
jgi:O-antigen ligase